MDIIVKTNREYMQFKHFSEIVAIVIVMTPAAQTHDPARRPKIAEVCALFMTNYPVRLKTNRYRIIKGHFK